MRYTKDLQINVCSDLQNGLSVTECSKRYNIPTEVVQKWGSLDFSEERAKEIALRKYINEVEDTDNEITGKINLVVNPEISDNDWDGVCLNVQKSLLSLVSKVVRKERNLNPESFDAISDEQIIQNIVDKWKDNPIIPYYEKVWKKYEGAELDSVIQEGLFG